MKTTDIKKKVADKVGKGKEKVAKKCGKAKACAVWLVALVLCGICGCSTADANPASRVTSARYGNILVFGSNTVTDGASGHCVDGH